MLTSTTAPSKSKELFFFKFGVLSYITFPTGVSCCSETFYGDSLRRNYWDDTFYGESFLIDSCEIIFGGESSRTVAIGISTLFLFSRSLVGVVTI